jgi:hypothetical protein
MRVLLLLFLLQSSGVFAQNYYPIQKTQLNKFVEDRDIEWAIYKNDSLFTDKPDLRDILIKKAIKNRIKVIFPMDEGSSVENKITYFTSKECSDLIYDRSLVLPAYSEGASIKLMTKVKEKIDLTEPVGELRLSQILYVRNGIIYSNVNRVSPKLTIYSAGGLYFGKADLFSTGLNNKLTNFNSKSDKIIFLKKTTTELYVDSIKKENKLKEMYGHNIIETLWPYIENNKIALYSVPENKKITLTEINSENLLNLQTVNIPMYDSVGNLSGTKRIITETIPTIFDRIRITQEWYYNETKNIVFCKIPDAILSTPKLNKEDNATHEIKIVF